ncbi:M3 family metallopeptidase [Arthrobacter sp. UM1]|uniref:M3 family metallopeptidase n=1 Tax=Arthrobacter sp. UM1 TaxID=2766776 RepID=UPI001CF71441|nr:M3 family metallopeptidase [Arthrobacter sp. UM1]MCB4207601.1 M3 family metallopeptidase [Arthrobacter sp. UM1]
MKEDLLKPSSLPGGLSDLSGLTVSSIDVLLGRATELERRAWAAISADDAAPTFENVVVPLEEARAAAERAYAVLGTFEGSMSTPEIQALAEEWAPKLAEHRSAAARNRGLTARLAAVPEDGLDAEQRHVLSEWRKDVEAAGAYVPEEHREELGRIEQELARCEAEYAGTVLKAAEDAAFVTRRVEDLAGLSATAVERARANAESAGLEGAWRLPQDLFCAPAAISSMTDPDARAAYYLNSVNRGRGPVRDAGAADTPENLALAARMAALRSRRAALFGASSHAELTLRQSVAGSVETALGMLERLVPKALASFERELDVMAETAGVDREGIRPSDVPFLLALVARERYSVDEEALRPYFELDRVLEEGVFRAARGLYGITFTEEKGLPVYEESVRVWSVRDEDGSPLGMFLGDFFARPTKQGGAWMHDLVGANGMTGERPVVLNTLNLQPAAAGEPVLLSLDNVRTLFHEFGHALHSLLTRTAYPSAAGTAVPRDFVEYPSQVNEMWMFEPGVVEHYAVHVETGEPLAPDAVEAVRASAQWGEGFRTSEYLGAALLDMAWHTRTAADPQIEGAEAALRFEEEVLARYGFDRLPVSPRYRTGNFKHIFAGGYAAGYYSYIYSEMMDAETVAWFEEHGGLSRENGERFRRLLLETGNRQDPAQSFRDFLGRDPRIEPLLRRRGLEG